MRQTYKEIPITCPFCGLDKLARIKTLTKTIPNCFGCFIVGYLMTCFNKQCDMNGKDFKLDRDGEMINEL